MRRISLLLVAASLLVLSTRARAAPPADPAKVARLTILQMNDVYEINPLSQGKVGGLARVASIRKGLLKEDPNTLTVLAGDLLNPSPMDNLPQEAPWKGKQIVDVMNTLGLDLAVLGNHEFDVKKPELLQRLAESRFKWLSANVTDEAWKPFPGVSGHQIREIKTPGGDVVRVAIVGVTIASNDADYVRYRDPGSVIRTEYAALAGKVDLVIALTHLDLADDLTLAQSIPEIDFVIGGHEHEANYVAPAYPYLPPIAKADANAKSVWVHRLEFDTVGRMLTIRSELKSITPEVPEDPETAEVAARWTADYARIFQARLGPVFAPFKLNGDTKTPALPTDEVIRLKVRLEGRDAYMRTEPTNLGQFIAETMRKTLPPRTDKDARPRVGLLNSGSVRIDDVIEAGTPLTVYDLMRILPFPGEVRHTTMKGEMLRQALDQSEFDMKTSGGYLQYAGIRMIKDDANNGFDWQVIDDGDRPIDPAKDYAVAMGDYLFDGRQKGFESFKTLMREDAPPAIDLQKIVAGGLAHSPDIKEAKKTRARPFEKFRTTVVQVGPIPRAAEAPALAGVPPAMEPFWNSEPDPGAGEPGRTDGRLLLGIYAMLALNLFLVSCLLILLRKASTQAKKVKEIVRQRNPAP